MTSFSLGKPIAKAGGEVTLVNHPFLSNPDPAVHMSRHPRPPYLGKKSTKDKYVKIKDVGSSMQCIQSSNGVLPAKNLRFRYLFNQDNVVALCKRGEGGCPTIIG